MYPANQSAVPPCSDAAQTKKGFVEPAWAARRVPIRDEADCEIVQRAVSAAFVLHLPGLTGASQGRSGATVPLIRNFREIKDGDEIVVFDEDMTSKRKAEMPVKAPAPKVIKTKITSVVP